MISNDHPNASATIQRESVLVIDLLPPIEDVNEALWTSEWLKSSSSAIETQIFKAIDGYWPSEFELAACLGVVITSSTCSCMDDYPHTEPLFTFFKTVMRLDVPVLAICYSAQMLVRWLAGKENVLRLPEPHIGFVRIETIADRLSLFNSVIHGSLISTTAQFDAFILPDESMKFSVQVGSAMREIQFIHWASATKWKYQAFQLEGLPVWGIQFHPNWPEAGAENVFRILKSHDPNIVVERQGNVDEDGQCQVARAFLFACRDNYFTYKL